MVGSLRGSTPWNLDGFRMARLTHMSSVIAPVPSDFLSKATGAWRRDSWRSYEASSSAVVLRAAHRVRVRRMRHEAVDPVVAGGELSGSLRPDQGGEANRRRGTGLRHQAGHDYRDGGCEVAVRRISSGAAARCLERPEGRPRRSAGLLDRGSRRKDHPTRRQLDIGEPEPLPDQNLERVPVLLIGLRGAMLRVAGDADVAPPVALQNRPQREPQTSRLDPASVDEASRPDGRRLDHDGVGWLVDQAAGHRDVLELTVHRTSRCGGAASSNHHDESGEKPTWY